MLRLAPLLLGLAWTLATPAAASISRGSVSTTFAVSVEGIQRSVVTSGRRSVDALGCSVRIRDLERQTLAFTTRTPGRLAAVRGRASSARVTVAVVALGTRLRTRTVSGTAPECAVAPQTSERPCGPTTYAGRATVALPRFGSVRLSGAPTRRGDAARCAPAAVHGRSFLAVSEGHFSGGLLTDPRAASVVLRGNARFTDTFRSGARRVTTVRWTITFRRLP
jgi:hypothetical protein